MTLSSRSCLPEVVFEECKFDPVHQHAYDNYIQCTYQLWQKGSELAFRFSRYSLPIVASQSAAACCLAKLRTLPVEGLESIVNTLGSHFIDHCSDLSPAISIKAWKLSWETHAGRVALVSEVHCKLLVSMCCKITIA